MLAISISHDKIPIDKKATKKERKMMKTWLVFNDRMDVIGTVREDNYTSAFILAQDRFGYVEYIQEI